DGSHVGVVGGTRVSDEEGVDPGHAVPADAGKVVAHRVELVLPDQGQHRLHDVVLAPVHAGQLDEVLADAAHNVVVDPPTDVHRPGQLRRGQLRTLLELIEGEAELAFNAPQQHQAVGEAGLRRLLARCHAHVPEGQ